MGVLLDFDDSGVLLDIIAKEYHYDREACCRVMFQQWLKGRGVMPCSWRKLIELLEDCDYRELAKEISDTLLGKPR